MHVEAGCCADTEGSFMVDRVVEIADACVRHLKKLANNNGTPAQKDAVWQTVTKAPSNKCKCRVKRQECIPNDLQLSMCSVCMQASNTSTENILSNIHFFRVRDYTEQVGAVSHSHINSHCIPNASAVRSSVCLRHFAHLPHDVMKALSLSPLAHSLLTGYSLFGLSALSCVLCTATHSWYASIQTRLALHSITCDD